MVKFSREQAARILAEPRATVEGLAELKTAPVEAPAEFEEPLERWRNDALQRSERRARAYTERQINQLRGLLEAHFEQRLAAEVGAAREFVLECVGQALGEFREMLVADMSSSYLDTHAKLHEEIDKLRARVEKLGGKEQQEPIDLPNPLARRLQ